MLLINVLLYSYIYGYARPYSPKLFTLPAFRADTPEQDIVAGEGKAVGIPDALFQPGDVIHVYVKYPAALFTAYMAVVMAPVVKAICPARNFHFANLPHFRQQIQIPIDRGLADSGVLFYDRLIDLIRGGVAAEGVDRLQNQGTLNGTNLTRYVIPSGIVL